MRFMAEVLSENVGGGEGGERLPAEARAVGAEHLDGVLAGLEAVARPGPPLAVLAHRHVVARHLHAVARPHVLDEAAADARHRAVRVDGLADHARALGALAPDHPA